MSQPMMNNPVLGMWLGSAHALMRMVHFWSGAWMLEPRHKRTDARG